MNELILNRLNEAFKSSTIHTKRELAVKSGMTEPVISRIFNGTRSLDIDELAKICKVLNASADYILQLDASTELFNEAGLSKDEIDYLKTLVREDIISDNDNNSRKWSIYDKLC